MENLVIFMINPFLYILYKIISYKTFLKNKKEYLFALSLAMINTYIPYNAGDSVRYAFKYYELMLFPIKEAWNYYLPHQDYLYYGTLFIFSRLGIPYHIFIIFTNFIIFYIILSLLRDINYRKRKIFYFLSLYMPIMVSLTIRFPLASYIMVYGILKKEMRFFIRIILIISAILIHQASSVILIIYMTSFLFYKFLNKFSIKIFSLILIIIVKSFYFNIDILHYYFSNSYIVNKVIGYSKMEWEVIFLRILKSKLNFIIIFIFLYFIFSYIYLFSLKKIKNKEYIFLMIFGSIIIAFSGIIHIPMRFCWIFNIFFVYFILKNKVKNTKILRIYKIMTYFYANISILIILYYSSYFYIKNYKSIPQIVLPTIVQIIGINNKYNEKIQNIAKEYPEKEKLGSSVMANLEEYYKLK